VGLSPAAGAWQSEGRLNSLCHLLEITLLSHPHIEVTSFATDKWRLSGLRPSVGATRK